MTATEHPRYQAIVRSSAALSVVAAAERVGVVSVVLCVVAWFAFISIQAYVFASAGAVLWIVWLVSKLVEAIARRLCGAEPATLLVDGDRLIVEGLSRPRSIERSMLVSGLVIPESASRRARLVLRGRKGAVHEAIFEDIAWARALIRELGLSALERPASFDFFFGLRVTVGADGVLVAWPLLRRRRFVAHSRIASVQGLGERIVIVLRDGGRYEIETQIRKGAKALERHFALLERIEDASDAYRKQEEAPMLSMLARDGRSLRVWLGALRALSMASAGGGGGYRGAALPTDTLWRIALDPAQEEELRIGASVVLGGGGRGGPSEEGGLGDDERARLRVAAEACASPKVRVALEATADGVTDDAWIDVLAGRAPAKMTG